jgi:hypothetical protein
MSVSLSSLLPYQKAFPIARLTFPPLSSSSLFPSSPSPSTYSNEVVFWNPTANGGIERTKRTPDNEPGTSRFPHAVLTQGRIERFLLDAMEGFSASFLWLRFTRRMTDLFRDDQMVSPSTVPSLPPLSTSTPPSPPTSAPLPTRFLSPFATFPSPSRPRHKLESQMGCIGRMCWRRTRSRG